MSDSSVIKIDVEQVLAGRAPGLYRFMPHALVNWLKKLVCQDEMNRLLEETAGLEGAEFCRGILKALDVKVEVLNAGRMPDASNRRVVFVSNHPLGGLDGMALIDMIQTHYGGQVWFVVNDLLMAVKPLEKVFLPVNKFGHQSREAIACLDNAFAGNDPIIVFPAGLCSRYRKVKLDNGTTKKMVCDLPWQKMFIQKSAQHHRDIVPLFFNGQNSMNFYRKANLRKRLGIKFNIEMVLLPGEMIKSRGKTFSVTVGNLKPHGEIAKGKNAGAYARELAREVYRLGAETAGRGN